ncbi:hypothetical protein Pyn_22597 [Prunus yedoensis var. nudiflora]|uniref:Uncharacterized protein n=1 Tax=Prunus yedoensis var. nudiflora TaxID=2094558 RepID=A0A315AZJ4_PRUYE|nr:hypothetical protein Pyn_22597 [Prunus yedoensis var. nudiflora]
MFRKDKFLAWHEKLVAWEQNQHEFSTEEKIMRTWGKRRVLRRERKGWWLECYFRQLSSDSVKCQNSIARGKTEEGDELSTKIAGFCMQERKLALWMCVVTLEWLAIRENGRKWRHRARNCRVSEMRDEACSLDVGCDDG